MGEWKKVKVEDIPLTDAQIKECRDVIAASGGVPGETLVRKLRECGLDRIRSLAAMALLFDTDLKQGKMLIETTSVWDDMRKPRK